MYSFIHQFPGFLLCPNIISNPPSNTYLFEPEALFCPINDVKDWLYKWIFPNVYSFIALWITLKN